jgi:NAD(P)-dependent dehydrogenase (short-subunit alcohol dehydrogenase family)
MIVSNPADIAPNQSIFDPVFSVASRTVVITGSCGLIGRELTRAFLKRGANVAGTDLSPLDKRPEFTSADGRLLNMVADVTNARSVIDLARTVIERFGRVDVLINSHHYKPKGFTEALPEEFPEELWDAIVEVNLKATFLTCREFGRAMLKQGSGSIINFASTYGVVSSNPDLYEGNTLGNPIAYSASKGGVLMLTKHLGAYWAERGVRVNCVTPHGVENSQEASFVERFSRKSPMRRLMRIDEIVGAVVFLASDASSYATASNLLIEGGWTAW